MMPTSNPIAQAVDTLNDQWVAFAQSERARILLWLADPDESTLIDALIARESDASSARTPDLFVQLSTAFSNEQAHGFALIVELQRRCELATQTLDPVARWQCPVISPQEPDVRALVTVLSSFHAHHTTQTPGALLALCLQPEEVSDTHGYTRWLLRLVRELPQELRVVITDDVAQPVLAALAEQEPARVRVTVCGLDFPSALESVAKGAGQSTPGDRFRVLQTQLAVAVREDALPRAEATAKVANELALAEGWPQLAAGIQMMLASAYSKQARHQEALAAYVEAERHARAREQLDVATAQEAAQSQPASELAHRLRLSALLGRGAVLLTMRAYQLAADAYLEVSSLAHQIDDARSELDGYRLAALCYSLLGQNDKAWHMGMHGLQFGLGLEEETRKTSTLAYLADQQLRLASAGSRYASHRRPLEAQLNEALGPQWRDQLVQASEG